MAAHFHFILSSGFQDHCGFGFRGWNGRCFPPNHPYCRPNFDYVQSQVEFVESDGWTMVDKPETLEHILFVLRFTLQSTADNLCNILKGTLWSCVNLEKKNINDRERDQTELKSLAQDLS